MKGKVKWFNTSKGYGFVISDEGNEYFVHWRSIVTTSDNEHKTLFDDEDVQFDTIDTDKGIQAINVVRLNPAN
jgi:CspA family cold shock protein